MSIRTEERESVLLFLARKLLKDKYCERADTSNLANQDEKQFTEKRIARGQLRARDARQLFRVKHSDIDFSLPEIGLRRKNCLNGVRHKNIREAIRQKRRWPL